MNKIIFSVLYLIVDILWISTMSKLFYKSRIENVQKDVLKFKLIPAIFAYLTLLLAMFYICAPLSDYYAGKYNAPIVFGIVGFVIYGVYNFTNGAIFNEYNWDFMIIDTIWGFISFMFFGFLYKKLISS